jgi:gamma-glutamylaminecyclotransferase
MHRVFVYGTLKRGFPNARFMDGAVFVGPGRTVDAYPLVVQGASFTPAVMPEPGIGHCVAGELWDVDDRGLAVLDDLETTHLPTGYIRTAIAVRRDGEACDETAWIYFKPRKRIGIVHSDPHADYQDRRYIPTSRRP